MRRREFCKLMEATAATAAVPAATETCRSLGIGFVAYRPLARGFLTGRFKTQDDIPPDDWRRHHPRFEGVNFEPNLYLTEAVRQVAEEIGCTPAQLSLAWALAQGNDIVPIPGTKRRRYLDENLGALKIRLTDEHLHRLDEVFPIGTPSGARYHEQGMRGVNL